MESEPKRNKDFVRTQIERDLNEGVHTQVATRFPPEPNGYLHIGHAKSICLNFGIAKDYKGTCNLRFDDTNPVKEDVEYVESIQNDIRWLGFEWNNEVRFASDYFPRLYQEATGLIKKGLAYVDESSEEDIRTHRGSLKSPGSPTPGRARSIEDNLSIFEAMKSGAHPDGAYVLRAKIDLAAANMKMRDPLMYRIRHFEHHRTGNEWCIYPMYDFAHPLSDALEDITHSICTLEFENNRELYDWFIEHSDIPSRPRQYEFARLALDYTIMSKRKLLTLVEDGVVSGWDDPRMPTIAGMRRRGYRAKAIRDFCAMIGVAKNNTTVDIGKLEYSVRNDLNHCAPRRLCVQKPLRVRLTNLGASTSRALTVDDFPADIGLPGSRSVAFSNELFIEEDDFQQTPAKGFQRLAPGRLVRLRGAAFMRCDKAVEKDGRIIELECSYVEEEQKPEGIKVSGVIHWVCAKSSIPCEIRLYDRLFADQKPSDKFIESLNPDSLSVISGARAEASLADHNAIGPYQFERVGYFVHDSKESTSSKPVFNRIVSLRDSWAKTTSAKSNKSNQASQTSKSERAKTRPAKKSKSEIRDSIRAKQPELASAYTRFKNELKIDAKDADVLSGANDLAALFESIVKQGGDAKAVAKLLLNELPQESDTYQTNMAANPEHVVSLIAMGDADAISAASMRLIFAELLTRNDSPQTIAKEKGLEQSFDEQAVHTAIDRIMSENPDKVKAYKEGKTALLGFFMGQTMKQCGANANAKQVKDLLSKKLS